MPRTRRWKKRARSAPPAVFRKPNRPSRRKQCTEQQMLSATALARSGEVSANRAADVHGVPRSTLKDRLHGRVVHGTNPGPRPYLEAAEEGELVDYIFDAAKAGYSKTRQQIKGIAEKVAKEKGVLKSKRISDGWWRRFMSRQPKLALRRGDSTSHIRMDAINHENMQSYFALLKEALDEHDLTAHPNQIYNMDETGMPFEPRPPKVVAPKGQKKVRYRSSGIKGQVTVVGCASATGQAIPPFIIFDAKQLNPLWTKGEVPGTRYGLSDSGWIDQELFHGWLAEHFLAHAIGSRPLLLLLDGHSSHFEPKTIRFAKENGVIVFCLPPHTTHEAQPLDCSLFGPLKKHWTSVCHEFYQSNPGKVITKFNFSEIFSKAWMKAVTPETICSGFRRAGVYPYNPNAIKIPDNQPSKPTEQSGAAIAGGAATVDSAATAGSVANVPSSPSPTFTQEQEDLFERRYEEKYDQYDSEYISWLELNHPEAVPTDRYSLITASSAENEMDLLSEFSNVTPTEPVMVIEGSVLGVSPPVTASPPVMALSVSPPLMASPPVMAPSVSPPVMTSPPVTAPSVSPPVTASPPVTTPSVFPPLTTPSVSPSVTTPKSKTSPVSQFLTPIRPGMIRKTGGARVLTSDECLQIMEEKALKKWMEAEEKEHRKTEREEKKRQREEEAKRKAAERAEKKKQCEEQKKRKAEEKARKAAEKARKVEENKAKEKTINKRSTRKRLPDVTKPPEPPALKKSRVDDSSDQINDNQCCVCFGTFYEDIGTGREWVECACTRWLHEDCVDEVIVDTSGQERVCPLCLS